jgi:twitching motility protein PilU
MDTHDLLGCFAKMTEQGASDLYFTKGLPPMLRVEDKLCHARKQSLDDDDLRDILDSLLTTRQKRYFEHENELNTALDMGEYGRFRLNVMRQRQSPALVIRRIVTTIPGFDDLSLPGIMTDIALAPRGLVLVTGMTGSGKTTTLAAMINHRNLNRAGHIVTIEDPIEYFHQHERSVITQREVGIDTQSYASALKNALRQRPDVILCGEVRDREIMEQVLSIADTGHLCLSTMHTNNASQAIERIVNMFSEDRQKQIRLSLSLNLKAIVAQRLVPDIDGNMAVAVEVLLNQGLIRDHIHDGKIHKIPELMQQNYAQGMCTFDQSLIGLYMQGKISEDAAIAQADVPGDVKTRIQKIQLGQTDEGLEGIDTSLLKIME